MADTLAEEAIWPEARLNEDYNARATVSTDAFAAEMVRYRAASEAARTPWGRAFDVVYDTESGQTLDIFGPEPDGRPKPVFVFLHGGYWRALSKRDSAMMADTLARQGIMTVAVDYRLAPAVTLSEIVREVRAAIAFLWREGARFGIDRDRITVGGSSAGGHLTGAVLAAGWQAALGLPEQPLHAAMPISGLFELAPLAHTFPQEWLSLSEDDIAALSPLRHIPKAGCPIVLAWSEHEPQGFKRQSESYLDAWTSAGHTGRAVEVANRNHFSVLMDLTDPQSDLSAALTSLCLRPAK